MQTQTEEAPSVRDALTKSIETLSADADGADTTSTLVDNQAQDSALGKTATQAAADDAAAGSEAGKSTTPAEAGEQHQEQQQRQAKTTSITDTPARQTRGPASWKPEVREKFGTLPAEVQAEVSRREREISMTLQDAAASRQFAEQFEQTIAPFRHIIALEGNDPLKTFSDYMKTATTLRTGSAVEKANAIASAIHTFGIDVNMLDRALAATITGQGGLPAQQGQHQQVYQDPRVDQLIATLTDQSTQRAQALEAELQTELEAFSADPANDFFEDLREDISDILRISAQRGRVVTLAEAYNKAAQLHPEISKVLAQREAAKKAGQNRNVIQAKRLAGSSVRTDSPHQTGNTSEPTSVRGAIEAAVERLSTG